MKIVHDQIDTISVITVNNEKLDFELSPDLKSQIILISKGNEFGPLILDLSQVKFADSSGLSALLLAFRTYRDLNKELYLCGLTDRVYKLLEIAQLLTIFNIFETKEDVLKEINAK